MNVCPVFAPGTVHFIHFLAAVIAEFSANMEGNILDILMLNQSHPLLKCCVKM